MVELTSEAVRICLTRSLALAAGELEREGNAELREPENGQQRFRLKLCKEDPLLHVAERELGVVDRVGRAVNTVVRILEGALNTVETRQLEPRTRVLD